MGEEAPNVTALTLNTRGDAPAADPQGYADVMHTHVDDVCVLLHSCSRLQVLDLNLHNAAVASTMVGAAVPTNRAIF